MSRTARAALTAAVVFGLATVQLARAVTKLGMSPFAALGVIVGIGLIGGLAVLLVHRSTRRFAAYAERRGWAHTPAATGPWVAQFTAYPFAQNQAQVHDTMRGEWNGRTAAQMVVGVANVGNRDATVWMLQMGEALPAVQFIPRIIGNMGFSIGDDLTIKHSRFSGRWRIMARNLTFARMVTTDAVADYLADLDIAKVAFAIDRDRIFAWTPGVDLSHEKADAILAALVDVERLISKEVWDKYGTDPDDDVPAAFGHGAGAPVATAPVTASAASPPNPFIAGAEAKQHARTSTPAPAAPAAKAGPAPVGIHAPGDEFAPTRDRNSLARMSVLLAFTCFLAPVSIVLGLVALRAVKEGRATNAGTARGGILLGIITTALAAASIVAAVTSGS